jgi:hypothetical protein
MEEKGRNGFRLGARFLEVYLHNLRLGSEPQRNEIYHCFFESATATTRL